MAHLFCASRKKSTASGNYEYHPITLKRAKRNNSCFSPAFLKRIVALALSPFPSTCSTSPNPKRSCSICCPGCTETGKAPPTAAGIPDERTDDTVPAAEENVGSIFFKLRGDNAGLISCTLGRSRRKRSALSSICLPNPASCGNYRKRVSISLRKRLGVPNTIFP